MTIVGELVIASVAGIVIGFATGASFERHRAHKTQQTKAEVRRLVLDHVHEHL